MLKDSIKTLLNLEDDDKILDILITETKEEIKESCDVDDADKFSYIIIPIVIFKYNQLSSLGISAESYNGASFTYSTDYPQYIKDMFSEVKNKNRKCRFI